MTKKTQIGDVLLGNALKFHVSQMIKVDLVNCPGGRKFSDDAIRDLIKRHKAFTKCYGCYAYSVRAGKGYTPIYVGSATRQSLGVEAFNSANQLKCLQYMADYKKGSLHITFIAPKDKIDPDTETRRGCCPEKIIQKLEKVLIAVAFRKNRNLINKQNLGMLPFVINGALNSDAGRPRKEVADFKNMLGLRDKSIVVVENLCKKPQTKAKKEHQC